MINPDNVFNLFANCIPVKGKNRSIICDVHRGRFRFIPNALYYILTHFKKHSVAEVKEKFNHQNDEFIDEYFIFLEKNEFIFYCTKEEQKLFPKLRLDFDFPSAITNCIIDFDKNIVYNYENLFQQLTDLNCNFWQLRFFGEFNLDEIRDIVSVAGNMPISSIHLVIPYHASINKTRISKIYDAAPISLIDFYNVPETKIKKWEELSVMLPFKFYSVKLTDHSHCGKIGADYFSLNVNSFGESESFNSCLNKKIGVDVNGNIKNCPSMSKSFGNIKDITLKDAMEFSGFKDVWSLNKDKISICKDCEFRYICTDCRAYTENPEDINSKPLKCGYDPYTNKWKEWSTNPLKQQAIEHYKMQDLVKGSKARV